MRFWWFSWTSLVPGPATIEEYGSRTTQRLWRRRIPLATEDFGLDVLLTDEQQPIQTDEGEPILVGHAPALRAMSGGFLRTMDGSRLRVI